MGLIQQIERLCLGHPENTARKPFDFRAWHRSSQRQALIPRSSLAASIREEGSRNAYRDHPAVFPIDPDHIASLGETRRSPGNREDDIFGITLGEHFPLVTKHRAVLGPRVHRRFGLRHRDRLYGGEGSDQDQADETMVSDHSGLSKIRSPLRKIVVTVSIAICPSDNP